MQNCFRASNSGKERGSYLKREQAKAGALKEDDDLASLANQKALKITIWACFGQRAGPQNIVRCQMQRNLRKKFILKSAEFTQKFRQTTYSKYY